MSEVARKKRGRKRELADRAILNNATGIISF